MLIDLLDAYVTIEDVDAAAALINALPEGAAPESPMEERDLMNAIFWSVYGDVILASVDAYIARMRR
jgi:hypothetical protein